MILVDTIDHRTGFVQGGFGLRKPEIKAPGKMWTGRPRDVLCLLLGMLVLVALPAMAAPANDLLDCPTTSITPHLGELCVTPPIIPTGQSVPITVTLHLRHPDYVPGSAVLQRLADRGSAPITIANFRDDGQEGDETAGDCVLSARAILLAHRPTTIRLQAAASFKNFPEKVRSLTAHVEVTSGASITGPWAVVEGDRVVFRDLGGRVVRQELLVPPIAEAATGSPPKYGGERAITSADGSHVAMVRPIAPIPKADAQAEALTSSGWEFLYINANGVLWRKTTDDAERYFYFPEFSPLLSSDGNRVLVIDVEEGATEPRLAVYDGTGKSLLLEKVSLFALDDARVSRNGQYLLLKGLPLVPKQDIVHMIVIDIDQPKMRWTVSYHDAPVTSEEIIENARGGFDIWLNKQKRYSFPP